MFAKKGWLTYTAAIVTLLYGVIVKGMFEGDWTLVPEFVMAFLVIIGVRRALPK